VCMKKRVNFTIDENLVQIFQKYCQQHGMKMSSVVEKLIKIELQVVDHTPSKELKKKVEKELWGIM